MPDKFYIDTEGNIRIVPEGKENKYLKKYPGSREASNKELSDYENHIADNKETEAITSTISTPESNNQSATLQRTDRSFTTIPKLNSQQLPDNKYPFSKGKSFNETAIDAGKKIREKRSQDSDYIVQSAINEYQSYKNWIDGVNNDPELSENVKKNLNTWFNQNFRDTDHSADDVRIPSLVRDYLDKNKQDVSKSIYVPGSPMFGGGTYVDGIVKENSPEQMAMIADFLINSPKGRLIMEDERLYLQHLMMVLITLEKRYRKLFKSGMNLLLSRLA